MIRVKLSTLIDSVDVFKELVKCYFKASTAYKLARLTREIEKELDLFDLTRKNLAKQYGEYDKSGNLIKDENGNYKIEESKKEEFIYDYNAVLNEEIELNAEPLTIQELDEHSFTAEKLRNILDFIIE